MKKQKPKMPPLPRMGDLPFYANHIDVFGTGLPGSQSDHRHIIFEFRVEGATVGHIEITIPTDLYDAWKKQFHDLYEVEEAQRAAGQQPGAPLPEVRLPPGSLN